MDYMLEAVAFEEWFETHSLSISAQLLWHKLMYLNYKNGWDEWVQLDNKSLMKLIEVKNESTLIKIRKELVEAGLIEYEMGRKGSPSRYKMKSIASIEEAAAIPEEQDSVTSEIDTACSSAGQVNTAAVSSEENTAASVQKEVSEKPISMLQENTIDFSAGFEKFYAAYPRKRSRALAERAYIDIILHAGVTEKRILAAAQNYAKECEKLKTKEQFIKMPHNWLKDMAWVDYLPENYREQEQKEDPAQNQGRIKNNRFNNIESDKYDYNELEKALFGCT